MRKWLACGALLGLIVIVASDANAQRPGLGGNLGLLLNKGVQDEIKLTEEQKEKVGDKVKEMFPKMLEVFGKAKDLSAEERQAKLKAVRESMDKELTALLKPEQIKRLKQIERQQNVVATLTADEEVVKALKLTDEQKKKLKDISDEAMNDLGELKKGKGFFSKENQEKIAAIMKEAKEKSLKLLTDEQTKAWKEMTGEPYEVKFEGFGGFGKKKKDD